MIEADRPTIASLLRDNGYATAMYGKWHVGLRYRRSDGSPAAGWDDADLTKPLYTTPLDHGFDDAKFTSRSHGTSGPSAPKESSGNGPGHVHGRIAVAATGDDKQLRIQGDDAYVLHRLGSRHSDNAMSFLRHHVGGANTKQRPFFLYYPSNSNHAPYTPDQAIGGKPVAGAARTKSGKKMDVRHDYIYENDVALGRMLDWLEKTDDPRQPGHKLLETTLVIFTSDNGAEKDSDIASGPFRSHKGSVYEGGHRVPFIVSWPQGGVGDGDASSAGKSNSALIGLVDMFATFSEIIGVKLPDPRGGEKGAEDSHSVLSAFRGAALPDRPPLLFNDHKEVEASGSAEPDPAAAAIRIDSPTVDGSVIPGQWKLFFDASLLRAGEANPYELYNLAQDQWEKTNLIANPKLKPLVEYMTAQALLHRNSGGHRLAAFAPSKRITFDWTKGDPVRANGASGGLKMSVTATKRTKESADVKFTRSSLGLGVMGGGSDAVDGGDAILISFDQDVLVESAAILAGDGTVGGFYRVGDQAPLAIYCVDGDIDARDQSGVLSDIGVLKKGDRLRLDSSPHYGSEPAGEWRLQRLRVRVLQ